MNNKERALQALTESENITTAARAADLSRRTLYNYLSDRTFRATLKRQREAQAVELAKTLTEARQAALQAVVGVMNDEGTPAAARIMAAKTLLQQASEADAKLDSLIQSAAFEDSCF